MNNIIKATKQGSKVLGDIQNSAVNTSWSKRILQRKQIAGLYQCNISYRHISWFCGCHTQTVKRWIVRIEIGETITERTRSGRPPIFTQDICIKTIAFYCQISPLPGCSTWSLRLAEKYLSNHREIVGCAMSHSTIGRILRAHALRPHLKKYFLQITDPEFFPKMEHIIGLYLNPPEYLFCFDECTGIQATQRLAPDLPVCAGNTATREFEYRRNGTTDLIAFLRPQTGDVFLRCTKNHNSGTLISVFSQHVKLQPKDVPLHYICDNYNTHLGEGFCKAIAKLCGITYTSLKTAKERKLWLSSGGKRITIHFVPFHGSWLNMIEIWFSLLADKCLKNGWFESVEALVKALIDFTETWNKYFAHPFTWTYRGEGLHAKVVSRFMRLLQIESSQMEIGFLTKQLMLMRNIAQNYWLQVDSKDWQRLLDLIVQKEIYISQLILCNIKKNHRLKAYQALEDLTEILYNKLVSYTQESKSA